jgi:hypothetical protein
VGFGGKVDHRPRLVLGQQLAEQRCIADVTLHKPVPGIAPKTGQRFQIARIGELVQIDHGFGLGPSQPIEHKIAADESGAAGHE